MGARKNRPGKFGTATEAHLHAKLRKIDGVPAERALIYKLLEWERSDRGKDHYVGWPDMEAAESLARQGYLSESAMARGCFHVTEAFRRMFMLGIPC